MSTISPVSEVIASPPPVSDQVPALSSPSQWLRRVALAPLKYLIAVLLATSWPTSILVVGWTYRFMHRSIVKQWFQQSELNRPGQSFRAYARTSTEFEPLSAWPNWVLAPGFVATLRGEGLRGKPDRATWRCLPQAVFGSLWQNLRVGVPAIVNTWVLTIPSCLIWLIFWSHGWNISFDKVYEESIVGASASLAGIALFIAVMHYLPLAQARHASTGRWRSFYDFRLVWKVARSRWMANTMLAACYALLALPILVMVSAPQFMPQLINGMQAPGAFEQMSDAELVSLLRAYFFWCCVYIVPAYVLLRWLAARSYASGLLALIRRGEIKPEELAPRESATMRQLGLLIMEAEEVKPHTLGRVVAKTASWTSSRLMRVACGSAVVLLWFSFAAQIYVGMFINYRSVSGWLNLPLIQLPWLKEIPQALLG